MAERSRPPIPRPPLGIRAARGEQPSRRERLTTERIVDAAMALMAKHGYDAVSMRSLAAELGTGPASLYTHVANREALDQLVIARVAADVPTPEPDPDHWQDQLKQLLRDTLAVYRAHPGSARAAMAVVPTEEGSLRAAEAMLAVCVAGGITPQAAAWFCDVAALYVGAVAYEEVLWTERGNSTIAGEPADHEMIDDQLATYFESVPAEKFPLVNTLARVLTYGDGDQRFEFGLDLLLSGLVVASSRYQRDDDEEMLAAAKRVGHPGSS
jgi:AcrR family transcriptional regulator